MRIPRVQFTIRSTMIAVAVAAITLALLIAVWQYFATPSGHRWHGALPFWGTLLISSATATAWVVASRQKKPRRS